LTIAANERASNINSEMLEENETRKIREIRFFSGASLSLRPLNVRCLQLRDCNYRASSTIRDRIRKVSREGDGDKCDNVIDVSRIPRVSLHESMQKDASLLTSPPSS